MELLSNLVRNTFRRPVTRLYPRERRTPYAATRGRLEMNPDTCSYCSVCEKRCPTGAITVTRKPDKSWVLRPHQCILCGYCIEACPKDSLRMETDHRPPAV